MPLDNLKNDDWKLDEVKNQLKNHWKTLRRGERILVICMTSFVLLLVVGALIGNDPERTRWQRAGIECQLQAEKQAKYGAPHWPWGRSFTYEDTHFANGNRVMLVEPDAQFQNGFGTYAHVTVRCLYDVVAKQVVNVHIGN